MMVIFLNVFVINCGNPNGLSFYPISGQYASPRKARKPTVFMGCKMEILAIVRLNHTFKFQEFSRRFDFEFLDFGVLIAENLSI